MDCPNCGTAVNDRYCGRCGQKQGERLVSTRRLLRDIVEDNFSIEGRLPRTLFALFFRPGRLTREYVAGRIARYVPPIRLYIVASLFFFLVLSLVADFDLVWSHLEPTIERAAEGSYVLVRTGLEPDDVPSFLRTPLAAWLRQEAELNAMPPREGNRVLYDAISRTVPTVVFLLVPGFALVLKLLYRRRYYAEHFVFVLHAHSLGFLLSAIALIVRETWFSVLLALALAVWLFAALRVHYAETQQPAERRWRSSLKYAALLGAYWIALSATTIIVMIVAVMRV